MNKQKHAILHIGSLVAFITTYLVVYLLGTDISDSYQRNVVLLTAIEASLIVGSTSMLLIGSTLAAIDMYKQRKATYTKLAPILEDLPKTP